MTLAPLAFNFDMPAVIGQAIGESIRTNDRVVLAATRYAGLRAQYGELLQEQPIDRGALDEVVASLVKAWGDWIAAMLKLVVDSLAAEVAGGRPAALEVKLAPLQLAPVEVRLSIDGPVAIEQDRPTLKIERDKEGNVVGVGPA